MPITALDPLLSGPSTASAKLTLKGVRKVFGSAGRELVAVDGFDYSVGAGEFVCILGPSGCGKTTILNMVAGFDRPTDGLVLMDGEVIEGPGADRAVVFQQGSLFIWMTVIENVAFGPRCRGKPRAEAREIARQCLVQVGLSGFEHHYPYELSGGMQQRVGIARVLANDPQSLLMDEPFAALDAQTREVLQEQIKELWNRSRKMVLWITHSIDEALFLATKLVVMTAQPGRIKASFACDFGQAADVRVTTSADFTRAKKEVLELLYDEARKADLQEAATS